MGREEREDAINAATLALRCPTCHVEAGEACLAMVPPGQPVKPASDLHGTRKRLGRAEFRRRFGWERRWSTERVLAECREKRRIVENLRHDDSVYARDSLYALAALYEDHVEYDSAWHGIPLE